MTHPHRWLRAAHKIAPNGARFHGISYYRLDRTERSRPFPTNLPVIPYHHKILRQPRNSPAGWGHPALRGNKNTPRGRGGASPARGFAAMTILRVIRRGGIYAARCSRTGNATQRVNCTERSRPFPTNLPKVRNFPVRLIDILKKAPPPPRGRFGFAAGYSTALNACSRSAMMSSTCSQPMDRRMVLRPMPTSASSASES